MYGSQASHDAGQKVNRPTEKASDTTSLDGGKFKICWENNSKTTLRD